MLASEPTVGFPGDHWDRKALWRTNEKRLLSEALRQEGLLFAPRLESLPTGRRNRCEFADQKTIAHLGNIKANSGSRSQRLADKEAMTCSTVGGVAGRRRCITCRRWAAGGWFGDRERRPRSGSGWLTRWFGADSHDVALNLLGSNHWKRIPVNAGSKG